MESTTNRLAGSSSSNWEAERESKFSPRSPSQSQPGLTEQVKEKAGEVMDTAKDIASDAKSKVQDAVHASVEAVSEKANEVGAYFQEHDFSAIGRDVTQVVRRHPIPALLIGVGLGIVLGRVIR